MAEIAKKQNILFLWLYWHFFEVPKNILKVWRNFLLFNLNYFSIPLLLKTFFSHWHRYEWSYGRGFDLQRYLWVFSSNMISRFLGAIMRSILIFIGVIIEIFIIFAGIILLLGWLILPVFLILGLIFGFRQILL